MRANDRRLEDDDGNCLGVFSSHWAACAAMIRLSNPEFRSLGGDKQEDLDVEARMTDTSQLGNTK